jgi:hypothetical protein
MQMQIRKLGLNLHSAEFKAIQLDKAMIEAEL